MLSFEDAFAEMPLVAILRGVRPDEVVEAAEVLHAAGFRLVEVPLNSPDPLDSIARLKAMAGRMSWGAGTVLTSAQAEAVTAAGGQLIVSPNADVAVIRRAVELGATPLPGFATATEGFAALQAGAKALKLFPAATYGPGHLKALKAVLPSEAILLPVGGVDPSNMADWWAVGARGFGLGGDLYKPGMSMAALAERAAASVAALQRVR